MTDPAGRPARAGLVDVHGHITPPSLLARLPMPPALGDIDGMIEAKAAAGIELTIVGSPVGVGTMMRVPGYAPERQTAEVLGPFHDWLASTVSDHKGALRAYCYCNPFEPSMLAYTAETVRGADGAFVGLIANSSVDGRFLDDPECDEFFAMADELGLPVLLHPPAEPVGAAALADFRLVEGVARFNDVTLGLAAMVMAGRFQRHPSLRVVAGMGGGALGLLADRLDKLWERPMPGVVNRIDAAPSSFLRGHVYTDTTSHSVEALRANVRVLGADRLLFGTDYPPSTAPLEALIGVVDRLGLADGEADAVLGGNARRLFGLGG